MDFKIRALLFSLFLGNCLVVGLIVAAFTTEYWIVSEAKRHNSTTSKGTINFGLFNGQRILNVGYGDRATRFNVVDFIQTNDESDNFWLWILTTAGAGFSLLSSLFSAILSAVKAAVSGHKNVRLTLILCSGIASVLAAFSAVVGWIVKFVLVFKHNVLPKEELSVRWYSTDQSSLGFSFYFLVFASLMTLVNVIILMVIYRRRSLANKKLHGSHQIDDENAAAGSIMLY